MTQHDFSQSVLAEAEAIKITERKFEGREEVSGITIDSSNSIDLDDAIHLEYFPDKFVIHVSVTDVSELIEPGTQLFQEVLKRTSTKYLSRGNEPMLPRIISEDRLSLLENQKRLTITFSITLTRDLEISKKDVRKTYLKNRRRLNYAQVDYILDSLPDDPDYQFLNDCYVIARRLMDKRRQNGALVIFDLQRLLFTNEEGQFIKLNPEDAHKSYIIVQEFMILANASVAELAAENEYLFLFRNHTARQTTPARNEILEQLKTAAVQPNQMNALIRRSELWFNKAKYEQKLAGHYGLNLPAYTHITSPLRRAADLVNHSLIKSQLWGKHTVFTKEELYSISSEINSQLLRQAEEKKDFFKEKIRKQTHAKITVADSDSLKRLGNNEFKKILREVCRGGVLTKDFEDVLLTRFNENKVGIDQLAILLFEADVVDESLKRLRERAFEVSIGTAGYSLQLINYLEQLGLIENLHIEVKEYQSHFSARIVATIDNKRLSTPKYLFSNNKKGARNDSANEFLKHYLENKLVAEADTEEADISVIPVFSENIIPNDEIPSENYIGQLMEFCMNNSQTAPEFEFSQEGLSHSPSFTCNCKLNINNQIFNTTGVSTNKRTSKQLAAKKMLNELKNYSLNMRVGKGIGRVINGNSEEIEENYIGLLNDKCLRLSLPMPKYQFSGSGSSHQPVFICNVSIKLSDELLTASSSAPNKKKAKQLAAKEMLNNLLQAE